MKTYQEDILQTRENQTPRGAMRSGTAHNRHRVVIVGCGFGGLSAAQGLQSADVDVTVIDRSNRHLFQPLLYQMATGILAEADIGRRSGTSCAISATRQCFSGR